MIPAGISAWVSEQARSSTTIMNPPPSQKAVGGAAMAMVGADQQPCQMRDHQPTRDAAADRHLCGHQHRAA